MRRLVASGVTVALLTGALSVVVAEPAAAVTPGVAKELGDLPEVPSVPLPDAVLPADPADAIDSLPRELDDLPADEVSAVPVGEGWTDVPGMPVDVRVPAGSPLVPAPGADESAGPEATEPPTAAPSEAPSDSPSEQATDSSAGVDGTSARLAEPTETPTETPSDQTSDQPSGQASDQPSDEPTDLSTSEPPSEESGELVVSLTQPTDLGSGVMLLQLQAAAPTTEPTEPADPGVVDPAVFVASTDDPADPGDPTTSAVDPTDGLDVKVSYAGYDTAYGADWADRLVIQAYPACFLDTPEDEECATGIPVEAVNNPGQQTLRFTTISIEELEAALDAADDPVDDSVDSSAPADDTTPDDGVTEEPSDQPSDEPTDEPTVEPSLARSTAAATGAATVTTALADEPAVIYSVTSAPGGYGPTPISPAGEWQVGAGSGEFSYSYPFQLPPALGGAGPGLSLSYSSSAVDGMTTAANGQASPAGLGWEMSPGYISRSYASCKDDGFPAKGDLCWKTVGSGSDERVIHSLTLSLNGQVSQLVTTPNDPNGSFRLKDDNGWRITRISHDSPDATQPDNADDNNEAFKVETPDGTTYWFGWGNGSESVWTVPVYGLESGEPCFGAASTNAGRWCQQAWRWNLDRVVDANGNEVRYSYALEYNHYARWADTTTDYRTRYTSGGLLSRVEYGFTRPESGGLGNPQQVVAIARARRCEEQLTELGADCSGSQGPKQDPSDWPDVPTDLICEATGSCTVGSPSFFTVNRYESVTTKVFDGGELVSTVDEYKLGYTMPSPDDSGFEKPDLWLNQITRIGKAGDGQKALDPVNFNGVDANLPNRVDPGSGKPFTKFRISSIRNETGGRIDVVYGHSSDSDGVSRACDAAYVSGRARWNSNKECFATKWSPPAGGDDQWEWFHKYVVKRIGIGDDTLGLGLRTTNYACGAGMECQTPLGEMQVFDYDYHGNPAWRHAGSVLTDVADESWSDWRGYGETTITSHRTTGSQVQGEILKTRITRYRGMSGAPTTPDEVTGGTGPTVGLNTVEKAGGTQPVDEPWLEGMTAETVRTDPGDNPGDNDDQLIDRVYTEYGWYSTVEFNNVRARVRYPTSALTTTRLTPSETRQHRVSYQVDPGGTDHMGILAGVVYGTEDHGGPADDDSICSFTRWHTDGDDWFRAPGEVMALDRACPQNPDWYDPDDAVARTKNVYDDLTRLQETRVFTGIGNEAILTEYDYDEFGRVTSLTTPGGGDLRLVTNTHYNPGGNRHQVLKEIRVTQQNVLHEPHPDPTCVAEGGPEGWAHARPIAGCVDTKDASTLTRMSPARGLPTLVLDANGGETHIDYNPLGQPTEVRYPGSTPAHPSITYTYETSSSSPSRVKTSVLRNVTSNGPAARDETYDFYDGWGRLVESQTEQPNDSSNRLVTVTGYDDQGMVAYQMPTVANPGTPGAGVVNPNPDLVNRYTRTSYDPIGRPTQVRDWSLTDPVATTNTSYEGDAQTTVTSPTGNTTTTDYNRRGQVVEVTLGSQDAVSYTYTATGQLATASKQLHEQPSADPPAQTYVWSYGYDEAGRQIWAKDPDTGLTVTDYDLAGNPTVVATAGTDHTIYFLPLHSYEPLFSPSTDVAETTTAYDRVSRPTAATDATGGSSTQLTTWEYDDAGVSNSAGQLTGITQPIRGVDPGTAPGDFVAEVTGYDGGGLVKGTRYTYPNWITGEQSASGTQKLTSTTHYNEGDLPVSTTYPALPGLPDLTVDLDYTAGGRFERAQEIRLDDDDNNPDTPPLRTPIATLAVATYNNHGETTQLRSKLLEGGNPTTLDRLYDWDDATGRLKVISTSATALEPTFAPFSLGYQYDKSGNPLRITSTVQDTSGTPTATGAWCYTYNGLDRLKTAQTGTPGTSNAVVDANGMPATCAAHDATSIDAVGAANNLTYSYHEDRLTAVEATQGQESPKVSYLYRDGSTPPAQPHQTASIVQATQTSGGWPDELPDPVQLDYDKRGRILTLDPTGAGATTTYDYNNQGQLTETLIGNSESPTSTATYAYHHDGTRMIRRVHEGDTTTTTLYLPDGTDTSGPGAGGTPTTTRTSTRTFTTPAGTPIASQTGSDTQGSTPAYTWLLADHQRSVRLTMDASASSTDVTDHHQYYPYGEPVSTGPPDTPGNRGYLDKTHDPNGDIRLDHRSYTPALNQLTTPDPLLDTSDPLSYNPYTYSGNNPIGGSDPSGLMALEGGGVTDPCDIGWSCVPYDTLAAMHTLGSLTEPEEAYYEAQTDYLFADISETVHKGLGVGGSTGVPWVADLFDAGDSLMYASEGNWDEASLSAGGVLPGLSGNSLRFTLHGDLDDEDDPTEKFASLQGALAAANSPANLLPAFPKELSRGPADTHVYYGMKNGQPIYAGITKNIDRRAAQHGSRKFDFLDQLTTTPLRRGEARAVEEALILRNADTFGNARHEISIKHGYYGDAVQWGEAWLQQNGYP